MAAFASYFVDFLYLLIQNVWGFIEAIALAFYKFFILDVIKYFTQLGNAISTFDIGGWICLIFVVIVNSAFVFFIGYRLAQLIRRYVIFRGKEVEKDKLLEEIAKLKEQADALIKEKNEIFALKVGGRPTEEYINRTGEGSSSAATAGDGSKPTVATTSRFTKLTNLDTKYAVAPHMIYMKEEDMISLKDIVKRFVNFAASQMHLYYEEDVIRIYLSAMATSKIIILEGISGTGKTSLPYAMGKFFRNNTSIISIQPSWRDRAELLGYFNEFTKKFNETDFLASLYEATHREDPNFIVLDEMNLARIEYYFADFLSIMEMPDVSEWKIDLIPAPMSSDPKNIAYGKLLVPQNVWFVGTANQDDSTFTITDKVYDRAVALALNKKADYFDAPITESFNCSYEYLDSLFIKAQRENSVSQENLQKLMEMDEFIRAKFKISFGNRIMKQLKLFVPVYMACGGSEIDGIDFIVVSKILRKFTSLNLPFLQKEMSELIVFFNKQFGNGNMKKCIEYIKELQRMS